MASNPVPRPPSATAAAYLMVAVGFFGLLRGMLLVNVAFHEAAPDETMPYIFPVPIVAGLCAPFIFRGANWGRIVFWALVGPLAITGLIVRTDALNAIYTLVFLVAGGLLATRNAHWFFTGRDYRRRPGFGVEREQEPIGSRAERERRKFEY